MRWQSSIVHSTPNALAMAIKCITALVEPPKTVKTVKAFSKDSRVTISLGFKSFSKRFLIAAPTRAHSSCLSRPTAGLEASPGKLIPIASIAELIVLAVYIPPQAPAPGIAL